MFEGKTVVVTGGARNLGAAICLAFASQGALVVLADANADAAREAADGLSVQGRAVGLEVDVSDRDSVAGLASHVAERYGSISALVNNAGVAVAEPFESADAPEVWDRTIGVNLTGMFNTTHAFLPALRETSGAVVNLASVAGFTSGTTNAGYSASKGGVIALTRKLARDLARDGIRVNAVAPGYMDTPRPGRSIDGDALQHLLDWHCPMRRLGLPHEVAAPVLFLCSADASYITGVTLPVDGGYLTV